MTAGERRAQIEKLLKEKKEIEVSELNKLFDVSGVTLRNDLIQLERQGVAKRLFGKVVLKNSLFQLNSNLANTKNIREKEQIGKYAATLINPGDSVLFYVGSTTQQVVHFLDYDMEFVAVTNSIYIAHELRNYPNVQTLLIGGNVSDEVGATYGLPAIEQIRQYNFDKVFLSVEGIDAKMGITNRLNFENDIMREILDCPARVIVVADHTKVGAVTFVQMGEIGRVDLLVTDSKADRAQVESMRSKGVEVVTV